MNGFSRSDSQDACPPSRARASAASKCGQASAGAFRRFVRTRAPGHKQPLTCVIARTFERRFHSVNGHPIVKDERLVIGRSRHWDRPGSSSATWRIADVGGLDRSSGSFPHRRTHTLDPTDHKTFSSAVIRSPRQTKRRCGLCSVHLGYTGLFLIEYFLLRSFTENAKAGGKRSRKRI